jgi:hypothetical protein
MVPTKKPQVQKPDLSYRSSFWTLVTKFLI